MSDTWNLAISLEGMERPGRHSEKKDMEAELRTERM